MELGTRRITNHAASEYPLKLKMTRIESQTCHCLQRFVRRAVLIC